MYETLNLKTLLGEHAPKLPQVWGAFSSNANFSPLCTFKISHYASYYRYLIAYEINAHRCKKRLGVEGVGGEGGCILKIVIARGGTIFTCNYFGGAKVLIHHTFLKTPAPLGT